MVCLPVCLGEPEMMIVVKRGVWDGWPRMVQDDGEGGIWACPFGSLRTVDTQLELRSPTQDGRIGKGQPISPWTPCPANVTQIPKADGDMASWVLKHRSDAAQDRTKRRTGVASWPIFDPGFRWHGLGCQKGVHQRAVKISILCATSLGIRILSRLARYLVFLSNHFAIKCERSGIDSNRTP